MEDMEAKKERNKQAKITDKNESVTFLTVDKRKRWLVQNNETIVLKISANTFYK